MFFKKTISTILLLLMIVFLTGCPKKKDFEADELEKELKEIEELLSEEDVEDSLLDDDITSLPTEDTTSQFHTPPTISLENIKTNVNKLSVEIGKRSGGAEGERKAAAFILTTLIQYGFKPEEQTVPLPNGLTSSNIIVETDTRVHEIPTHVIVLGAHYDTKLGSPGANDNGTGIAILLELAKYFKEKGETKKIRFIFFGTEEMIDKDPDHHHYGSRFYVSNLKKEKLDKISAMISVDMVGFGENFNVLTMGVGTKSLANDLIRIAKDNGINLVYRKSGDWSDHEPFEKAGVPSAWLQWRSDPSVHTVNDTYEHIQWERVETTVELLLAFLESKDA